MKGRFRTESQNYVLVGTIANRGSFAYEHLRYAIDRWNTEHGAHTQIKFSIAAPIRYDNNYEERSELVAAETL